MSGWGRLRLSGRAAGVMSRAFRRRSAGVAAVCAMVVLAGLDLASRAYVPEYAELMQPELVRDGSMLVGWGASLPGVARPAQPHVHEFGAFAGVSVVHMCMWYVFMPAGSIAFGSDSCVCSRAPQVLRRRRLLAIRWMILSLSTALGLLSYCADASCCCRERQLEA